MKLGKVKQFCFIFAILLLPLFLNAEDKISTVPLIDVENIKPSYEEVEKDEVLKNNNQTNFLKEKIRKESKNKNIVVNILGLDKITAKTSEINIKLGETKKFGLLEIKALHCGNSSSINETGAAAYIQVKDVSDNRNEKVFVFNGWTFSSSPSLRPIEHPVYDLWLVGCENV